MAKGTTIYGVYGDESPSYYPTKKEAVREARKLAKLMNSSADVSVELCQVRSDLSARDLMCRFASNSGGWCGFSVQILTIKGSRKDDE